MRAAWFDTRPLRLTLVQGMLLPLVLFELLLGFYLAFFGMKEDTS